MFELPEPVVPVEPVVPLLEPLVCAGVEELLLAVLLPLDPQ